MIGVVSSSLLGVKMDKERSCVRDLLEIIREIIDGSLEGFQEQELFGLVVQNFCFFAKKILTKFMSCHVVH